MSLFNINQVTLLGNVVKVGELKHTQNDNKVINFTVATNFSKKVSGSYEDFPTFHDIVVWGKMAEFVENLEKGSKVYVQGRLEKRSYENKEGRTVYITEVIADRVIGLSNTKSTTKVKKDDDWSFDDNNDSDDDDVSNDVPF